MRCFIVLLFLFFHGLSTGQESDRFKKANAIFERDLIFHFIHPQQLDTTQRSLCEKYVAHMLANFTDDFTAVRFEKGFKNSPATNVFFPVFIFSDGREISLPHFKILQ